MSTIRLRGLTVDFPDRGIRALDGVDLDVAEGDQIALLGPSGSGKSTLLRSLLGALRPAAGEAQVAGADPFGTPEDVRALRRRTGTIRQGDDLVLGVSGRTNAVLGTASAWGVADWLRVARGRTPARWEGDLVTLAAEHGVTECLPARAVQLSGGQRQRIALIRALLPGPRLLLADEPTAGLDPTTASAAVDALLRTAVTLVVATHDLGVARRFARVVALREGRVVHDGPGPDAAAVARIYATTGAAEATGRPDQMPALGTGPDRTEESCAGRRIAGRRR